MKKWLQEPTKEAVDAGKCYGVTCAVSLPPPSVADPTGSGRAGPQLTERSGQECEGGV